MWSEKCRPLLLCLPGSKHRRGSPLILGRVGWGSPKLTASSLPWLQTFKEEIEMERDRNVSLLTHFCRDLSGYIPLAQPPAREI